MDHSTIRKITKLDLELDGSDKGLYHKYVGFDRVVDRIDKQLQEHGPFDAAVGFSQGGQMLTALSMYYLHQRNERHWKCCLICSGTRVRDNGLPKRVPIPSIHLIGKYYQYYSTFREHAELYADNPPGSAILLEHEYGHHIPPESSPGSLRESIRFDTTALRSCKRLSARRMGALT
ncbi:Serine hydrolase (FSH1) [Phytophthora megakarya]|uniref:Serine hydrolase (FSH1) n=1 Tax=Phytophthora megakarya TaxID=4795 RepID=A0A225WPL5_9STRA|nr:Serine hydrolase (FSH1) [Phytophthora megakarya]